MSIDVAREYFHRADAANATIDDLLELFAEEPMAVDPYVGSYTGRDGVERFFETLGEVFSESAHDIEAFHADGGTVVCEGTITGETTAGRAFTGVGVSEIMRFNESDRIEEFRVYVDYSAILRDIPEEVPDYRTLWE